MRVAPRPDLVTGPIGRSRSVRLNRSGALRSTGGRRRSGRRRGGASGRLGLDRRRAARRSADRRWSIPPPCRPADPDSASGHAHPIASNAESHATPRLDAARPSWRRALRAHYMCMHVTANTHSVNRFAISLLSRAADVEIALDLRRRSLSRAASSQFEERSAPGLFPAPARIQQDGHPAEDDRSGVEGARCAARRRPSRGVPSGGDRGLRAVRASRRVDGSRIQAQPRERAGVARPRGLALSVPGVLPTRSRMECSSARIRR